MALQPSIQKMGDDVSSLKQDMVKVGTLVTRLDDAIDKLTEVSSNVSSLLAVHDNKISTHESTLRDILDMAEKRRTDIDAKLQFIHDRISATESKMDDKIKKQYDDILQEIKDMREETKKQHTTLSERLTAVEKWVWVGMGVVFVAGIIISNMNINWPW